MKIGYLGMTIRSLYYIHVERNRRSQCLITVYDFSRLNYLLNIGFSTSVSVIYFSITF
jgi:hypothetical protein